MNSNSQQGTINKSNNQTKLPRGSRKGALLSAAATIGLLSTTTGEHNDAGSSIFAQAIQVHDRLSFQQRDVTNNGVVNNDDIGKSSADDMFAFSQIVAAGGNPMEVAQQMEKEQAAAKVQEKTVGGLSEDQAVAAFAEFMSGEGSTALVPDPRKIQAEKEAAEKAAKAKTELKELATNDATSAFACLVDSQVIQEKAATYEGSGSQAEQEAAVAKGVAAPTPEKKDPLLAVQQQSEAELAKANKQVEVTDTAQEAASALGAAGNVQTAEDNTKVPAKGGGPLAETKAGQGSKLQTQINRLKSGYTVSDLKKAKAKPAAPAKKKAQPAKKGAAPAKKAKPAPAAKGNAVHKPAAPAKPAEPERGVDLQASIAASQAKDDASVDNQADEILDQIRSAAVGIKGIGGGGGGVDEESLQAAVSGMNLVQLDSDVKDHDLPDENAQLAMEYLAQQFPDEYPRDHPPKAPAPKGPTPEETEAADKQALLAYAQQVTAEATESRDKVVAEIADSQEKAKLARMGMEGEAVTLQLGTQNLVQVGADMRFDADALEAQAYLEQQFPSDYPEEKAPKKAPTPPSEEEVEQKKAKELLQYAQQVTEAATESRDQVVLAIAEKKEKAELSKMGVDPSLLPENQKPVDWKELEAKMQKRQQTLLQLSSKIAVGNAQVDENVEIAQAYLEQAFPDDYPKPPPPPKAVPKPPPPEEVAEKERQALISYSAGVAAEAKAYQEQLKDQDAAAAEAKELSKMGYEEKFKPEYAPKRTLDNLIAEASFLQLSEDVKIDARDDDSMFDQDSQRALDYLSKQFPKDFPPDKPAAQPAKTAPKPATEEDERAKALKTSQAALQVAEEYHAELDRAEKEKKEKAEIAKLTNDDQQLVQTAGGSPGVTLAQVEQKSKQGLLSETEAEEGAALSEQLEEGAEAEAVPQAAPAAPPQADLSGMSADDMRSYSESVAQAADVVNNESEAETKKDPESMSLGDLKKASIASTKAQKATQPKAAPKIAEKTPDAQLLDQEQKGLDFKNPDLEAKAALVAQAEAANQAAIDGPDATGLAAKSAQPVQNSKVASLEELDADHKKEQQKQQEHAKYAQDKQMALDQGYSEEQAELFAKQEAYAASLKLSQEQALQSPTIDTAPVVATDSNTDANGNPNVNANANANVPKPVGGPTSSPPTIIGRDKVGSSKESAPVEPSPTAEDSSIEQQIKQAQEQQALIKAQLEKKKQEKQSLIAMNQIGSTTQASNDATAGQPAPAEAAPSANQQKAEAMAQQQMAAEQQALAQAQAQADATQKQQIDAQKAQDSQKQAEAIYASQQAEQAQELAAAAQAQNAMAAQQAQSAVAGAPPQAPLEVGNVQAAQSPQVPAGSTNPQAPQKAVNLQQQQQATEADALAEAQAQVMAADQQAAKDESAVAQQLMAPSSQAAAPKEATAQAPVHAPAPVPVAAAAIAAPEGAPVESQLAPAEPPSVFETKPHKKEKSALQQSEDINRHTPKAVKKQLKILSQGKSRAAQYEEDLNRARDEIQKAQLEMKNIDSEVTDFHQKMAKSMHSLLKAFTEGFEAMDKAKSDELDTELAEDAEKKRARKLDKLNVGISNLEALTSKLKLSFGDDADATPASDEAVQARADIHQPAAAAATEPKKEEKPIDKSFLNSKIKQEAKKLTIDNSKQPPQQKVENKQVTKQQMKPQAPAPAPKAAPPKPQVQQKAQAPQRAAARAQPQPQPAPAPKAAPSAKPQAQPHQQHQQVMQVKKIAPAKPAAAPQKPAAQQKTTTPQKAVKIQPKGAVKTVKVVKKQMPVAPAAAPKVAAGTPKTLTVKKVAPQQLQQVKAAQPMKAQQQGKGAAKTVMVKPIQKQVAGKPQTVKPALQSKMQLLLDHHVKPGAQKTGVKTVQLVKKAVPAQTKVVAKGPAPRVAKSAKVGLAQVKTTSGAAEGSFLQNFDPASMQTLLQTKDKLHHLYQAIGEPKEKRVENLAKSYGIEMDEEMNSAKAAGSNQVIAHAIADRLLMQMESGKSKQAVMSDLGKTKQALKLAQKAFYEKDPEAIELLQLDESDKSVVDVSDKIFLFDKSSQQGAEGEEEKTFVQQLTENMELIGDNEIQSEVKENDEEVQAQLDQVIGNASVGKTKS